MAKYRYILFDLDGTLTDSRQGIINSFLYALKKMGIEETDYGKLEKFILGPPLAMSFRELYNFDEEHIEAAIAFYREYFTERGMFENRVYPGIANLLNSLNESGCSLMVATSKPAVYTKQILEHFELDKLFSAICGSQLDGRYSSKKEIISMAINQVSNPTPEEFVMIGDRKYDIIGAKGNGIDGIGVTYGYGTRSELTEVAADKIVSSVTELHLLLL